MSLRFALPFALLILFSCQEQNNGHDHSHDSPMLTAALHVLETFDDKDSLIFGFQTTEQYNWHLYPKTDRIGKRYSEMTPEQQEATMALLRSTLSELGEEQVAAIMQLETVLKALEKRADDDDHRHPGKYYLAFFGKPKANEPWGWRFEGHHISLNISRIGDKISASPMAFGSYPARNIPGIHDGREILKEEEEKGRALVRSFDQAQLASAKVEGDAPDEILTGFAKEIAALPPDQGLSATDMNASQRAMLEELVRLFFGKLESPIAEAELKRMADAGGLDALYFVWMGGLEPLERHYYRIYGPTMILEYDNTQNDANHIHVVWRDPSNNFGENYLLEHYQSAGAGHGHSHD